LLFGFLTSFFEPCCDFAMIRHLFRLLILDLPLFFVIELQPRFLASWMVTIVSAHHAYISNGIHVHIKKADPLGVSLHDVIAP
jgi:hypothetical protein